MWLGSQCTYFLCGLRSDQFPSDENNFSVDTVVSSLRLAPILLAWGPLCLWEVTAYLILTVLTFWFNSLKDNLFGTFPSSWGSHPCDLPTYEREHSHAHRCSREAGQHKQQPNILKECCFETRCVGSSKNRSQTENIQRSQRGRVRNKHLRHPFSPLH